MRSKNSILDKTAQQNPVSRAPREASASDALASLVRGSASTRIHAIRSGFSAVAADNVRVNLGISQQAFYDILGTSARNAVRLVKEDKALDPASSERLLRLVAVEQHATDVFGKQELAIEWLKKPNAVLGCAPIDLLDTKIGHQEVTRVLTAIEYGISV